MSTVTLRRKIDSETLQIPELKPMIGKNVEITIREFPVALSKKELWDKLEQLAQRDVLDLNAFKEYEEFELANSDEAAP
jgi:hypothetical protein